MTIDMLSQSDFTNLDFRKERVNADPALAPAAQRHFDEVTAP